MRRGTSVQVVVVAVFCCVVLFGALPGQVVHATDRDVAFPYGDSSSGEWTSLADMIVVDENRSWASEPEAAKAVWPVDDFEDGNIDGWEDEGNGACYATTSAIAANGTTYSMRVDGACGHHLGRVFDITGSMPTGISVWVRSNTVDTFDTYLVFGDSASGSGGNTGAINFQGNPGVWSVFNGAGFSCGSRNPNQWYDIDFNIDWACKMYDVSIDGVPKLSNVSFYHVPTESFDRIHVYNWDDTTARYDEIYFYTPGASPLIFEDNFERASTCRWSAAVP